MDYERIVENVKGIPYTSPGRGKKLYDHVLRHRPKRILELGFAHGVSTCYLAAALDELGSGSVTTMDMASARNREPNVEQLATSLGLGDYIDPIYCESSFTWDLRSLLSDHSEPIFDLVFHDAGHTWDVAGYGFFLTDPLLRPGGWMLFDDLDWTLEGSRRMREKDWVRQLPDEQRTMAQVGQVYDLLVKRHRDYVEVARDEDGAWAWVRKRRPGPLGRRRVAKLPPY